MTLALFAVAHGGSPSALSPVRRASDEHIAQVTTSQDAVGGWVFDDQAGAHTVVFTVEREEAEVSDWGDEGDKVWTVGLVATFHHHVDGALVMSDGWRLDCATGHQGQDLQTWEAEFRFGETVVVADDDHDGLGELTFEVRNLCDQGPTGFGSAHPARNTRTVVTLEQETVWTLSGSVPIAWPGRPTEGGTITHVEFEGAPAGALARAAAVWAVGTTADPAGRPDESMGSAVASGERHRLLQALARGRPIDEVDVEAGAALHRAAVDSQVDTVRWLLDHGADPNVEDDGGQTPLLLAVRSRAVAVVELLLDRGARVDGGIREHTPLQEAVWARADDVGLVPLLLERGASPSGRPLAMPPLRSAVRLGDRASVAALLALGADPNERGLGKGGTLLHDAATCKSPDPEIVDRLATAGARHDVVDDDGRLPVERALGSPEVLRALLRHGADGTVATEDDRSLLERAAADGNAEAVQVLLDAGVAPPADGPTDLAALNEAFARRRARDDALFAAISAGDLPAALGAIADGARVDARRRSGNPLVRAALEDELPIVLALLERGAKVDSRDPLGRTPLHEAARRGRASVAEALLAAGADPRAASTDGKPVIYEATVSCSEGLVRRLHAAGAPLDTVHGDGQTVWTAAAEMCPPSMTELLTSLQ